MNWQFIAIVLLVLLVYGMVGMSDYANEEYSSSYYCQMVEDGYWPKYKGECE